MNDASLRQHLTDLLRSRNAHVGFEGAVEGLPAELRGRQADGLPHTAWQLLEHLRIAQWDILEFSRDPDHVSPAWPAGYWPETATPPGELAWDESLTGFRRDLEAMCELVRDTGNNLFVPFPWGDGQTLLREALLVADHNAYHVGQFVDLRRLLGAWPGAAWDMKVDGSA